MNSIHTAFHPVDRTLINALQQHLQAETGQAVPLIETHISWVLLTDRLAYKLKKPVGLPFVDFRTLAARKHFCEEELRLNRRLAPEIYIDVTAVCGTSDAPRLGAGVPIDYVVRMRRFPEASLLRNLVLDGRLQIDQLARFAQRLAGFHERADAVALSSGFGTPEQVLRAMQTALAGLADETVGAPLAALRAWVDAQGSALWTAWAERHCKRFVRECHGDLHLSNVVLIDDELTAFDCIEFDPALRWIDVMSDVAFLSMDFKAHGRADLAHRFLDVYLQHTGDYAAIPVLRAYEVYRALVRAMVARLRDRECGDRATTAGPDYLACAAGLAGQAGRPTARLMITHGLSGSGKTTIATEMLASAGAIRIRSDVERKRLFGLQPLHRSMDLGHDIYTPDATRRTFDRLWACARTALQAGYPVIVDAAFLRRDERLAFRALAIELGVPFAILHCEATPAQLRERVAARQSSGNDASEATLPVLERQLATHEPLDEGERATTFHVVSDASLKIAPLVDRWLALKR
ncbi:AAA family ATPase [Variovorax ginsengisoli]|uniref:AAA family ATPase n=1 Tax=Variovorax ginsengisoli TaxID=363844 RepID=A0ABT8S633_9BURK|nr:bifunctional aminoglycoside phosphotransferase/ATP-binding protein [Variovorax ginsengisoli]MDN8615216.1 AAA family ATPase [Variovorax ginsengisoli]MDO1534386.1 AAA family ATPase [Variovorax ginsengisoli]